MRTSANGNMLYELAQAMAANEGHSEATALRMLAQAGYSSLEEVDSASDWAILSIPGLGIGRLHAVRRLTRVDWKAPAPQAVKALSRFVAAARFALRFWPIESLLSMLQGASLPAVRADHSAAKRLAVDLLRQAADRARCYCTSEELIEALQQTGHGCIRAPRHIKRDCGKLEETDKDEQDGASVARANSTSTECNTGRDSDHFAFASNKRREIVQHYRAARESGQVTNKEAWASKNYGISGRTLLRYEREYEQAMVGTP